MGRRMLVEKNDGHVPGSEVRVYTHVLGPKETQNNKAKRVAAPGARVSPRAQAGLAGAAPPRGKQVQDSGQLLVEAIGLGVAPGGLKDLELFRATSSGEPGQQGPARVQGLPGKGCWRWRLRCCSGLCGPWGRMPPAGRVDQRHSRSPLSQQCSRSRVNAADARLCLRPVGGGAQSTACRSMSNSCQALLSL